MLPAAQPCSVCSSRLQSQWSSYSKHQQPTYRVEEPVARGTKITGSEWSRSSGLVELRTRTNYSLFSDSAQCVEDIRGPAVRIVASRLAINRQEFPQGKLRLGGFGGSRRGLRRTSGKKLRGRNVKCASDRDLQVRSREAVKKPDAIKFSRNLSPRRTKLARL